MCQATAILRAEFKLWCGCQVFKGGEDSSNGRISALVHYSGASDAQPQIPFRRLWGLRRLESPHAALARSTSIKDGEIIIPSVKARALLALSLQTDQWLLLPRKLLSWRSRLHPLNDRNSTTPVARRPIACLLQHCSRALPPRMHLTFLSFSPRTGSQGHLAATQSINTASFAPLVCLPRRLSLGLLCVSLPPIQTTAAPKTSGQRCKRRWRTWSCRP